MSSSSFSEWSVGQVCEQLDEEVGLDEEVISLFREARVDGERLLSMTEDDLKDLGMTSGRKGVLKFIERKRREVNK
jgi:hypothetical protein